MYTDIISASSLNTHLKDVHWRIIDCRFSLADTESGRRDFNQNHISGAVYAHLDDDLSGEIIKGKTGRHPLPEIEKLVEQFSVWGINEKTQVIVYDDKGGAIAARLWWMLRWLGHERVAVLDGGWQEWLKDELPTDNEIVDRQARFFEAKVKPEMTFNFEQINKLKEVDDFVLVDSRAAIRYRGEEEPIDPIAGHVPNAINLPFAENLGANGLIKSREVLKERFLQKTNGIAPEQTAFYCGSGVTACYNLLAYHYAGLGNARLYPGSWSEWILEGEVAI